MDTETTTSVPTGSTNSDTGTPPSTWPGIEAACVGVWAKDRCTGGCPTAEQQVWADGYLDFLAGQWALPRSTVDQHVKVRSVKVWGTPTRYATVHAEIVVGWAAATYDSEQAEYSGVPTEEEAAAAFDPRNVPQIDVTAAPRPWAEVSQALADCEAELGVTFDQPWCEAYVDRVPDRWGLRFDFFAESYDPDCAQASVGAFDAGEDSCSRTACYTY